MFESGFFYCPDNICKFLPLRGENYTIKNITIDCRGEDYVGIGKSHYSSISGKRIESGTVKHSFSNLNIENITVKGNSYVGVLGGSNVSANNCTITNATVTGTGDYVGGLVGCDDFFVTDSKVFDNCVLNGISNVTGLSYVGGIVGYSNNTSFSKCSSVANVEGKDYVGGLCGYFSNKSISQCSSSCNVKGENYVGGIVGNIYEEGSTVTIDMLNWDNETGFIEGDNYVGGIAGNLVNVNVDRCYSRGIIKGSTNYIGGITGRSEPYWSKSMIISSCFSIAGITIDNTEGYAGGIVGYGDAYWSPVDIRYCYFTGSFTNNIGIIGYTSGRSSSGVVLSNCLTTASSLGDATSTTDCEAGITEFTADHFAILNVGGAYSSTEKWDNGWPKFSDFSGNEVEAPGMTDGGDI
jgi:hypothetical protein